jgi:ribosome biogenesis GTPase
VNLSHQMHIIASNLDYVFLLITVNNPPTTFNFIDRFLVTAEAYGIETILVFNKIDCLKEPFILGDETIESKQAYIDQLKKSSERILYPWQTKVQHHSV